MDNKTVNAEVNVDGRKKRKRRGLSYYFTAGVLGSLLDKLVNGIYNGLQNGLFGRMFTSYSSSQRGLQNSYLKDHVAGGNDASEYVRKIRGGLSSRFESSFFLWLSHRLKKALISTPLKIYGNYFLSFGLYTIFAYFVFKFTDFLPEASSELIVFGAVIILLSIPMLLSKESLAEAMGKSRIMSGLLCGAFGFRKENFEVTAKSSKLKANLAIILGTLSGFLTFLVEPLHIIIAMLAFVAVMLVISTPEIGVIMSLFLLPFFSFAENPSIALTAFVGITALSTLMKLIRGKRILRFEFIDVTVILFMVAMLLSGAVSAGGRASLNEVLLCAALMLIYFLIVNMMRTEIWIRKCIMALVSSAVIVSLVGIFEYIFGELDIQSFDIEYFSGIKGRTDSLFDNANLLGFYLVMVFPLVLDMIFRANTFRKKTLAVISACSVVACVIFTWSRGAWLALLASSALYLMIRSRKALKAIFGLCLAIPVLPFVLPQNILDRFMSIGDMADSSTFYRVYTWKGTLNAVLDNFWSGVGYGNSAFSAVYPQYAYAGIEAAEHSHNLFLQILFGMGIGGLLVFLFVLVVFSQKNLQYLKNCKPSEFSGIIGAAFSAFFASMVIGMFDYPWYNYRIFFLFWVMIALSCAAVRVADDRTERETLRTVNECESAQIDIE